jgi:hypothetical protein
LVELVSPSTRIGQVLIHQGDEPVAVLRLAEVGHLLHEDVLQAVRVFCGEFEVERDVVCLAVAGAPLGLHPSDAPTRDGSSGDRFPHGDEWRDPLAQLLALPGAEQVDSAFL